MDEIPFEIGTTFNSSTESISFTAYSPLTWNVRYSPVTLSSQGSLVFNTSGGHRKVCVEVQNYDINSTAVSTRSGSTEDIAIRWRFVRDTISGEEVIRFSGDEYLRMADQLLIRFRQPKNGEVIDTVIVGRASGAISVSRPVILPSVPGITTQPGAGTHYVPSREDFMFMVELDPNIYPTLPSITTSRNNEDLRITLESDNRYKVVIPQITQTVVFVSIDGIRAESGDVANDVIVDAAVWSTNGNLYLQANDYGVAYIYNVAGALVKTVQYNVGATTAVALEKGIYILKLSNGASYKVNVK